MTERSTTAFTLVKGATKSAVEPPTFRFGVEPARLRRTLLDSAS
jgi:hypothetical protein